MHIRGPFSSQDDAGRAALTYSNPLSIADNLEYGGLIYTDAHGQFWYTGPAKGDGASVDQSKVPAPPNTLVVGDYHTHADYAIWDSATATIVRTGDPERDDFDSDNFSTTDLLAIARDGRYVAGYKGYLGTPSGTFKIYDTATNTVSVLG